MDYLRQGSTRTVQMRFYRDDLGITLPVTWYEVPDDAPVIPYGHPFASRDWDFHEGSGEQLLGEVQGTRRYYAGPALTEQAGQGFCGSREQWVRGLSTLDKPLPLNPTTGRQCCCGRGSLLANAVSVRGLSVETEGPPLVTACAQWNPSPQRWAGFWGVYPVPEGSCLTCNTIPASIALGHTGGCNWRANTFFTCLVVTRGMELRYFPSGFGGFPPGWFAWLRLPFLPLGSATWYLPDDEWNQYGPNTMPLVFDDGGCVWPSITLFASW